MRIRTPHMMIDLFCMVAPLVRIERMIRVELEARSYYIPRTMLATGVALMMCRPDDNPQTHLGYQCPRPDT